MMSSSRRQKNSADRHTYHHDLQGSERLQANAPQQSIQQACIQKQVQGQPCNMKMPSAPQDQQFQFSVQFLGYNVGNGMSWAVSPAGPLNVPKASGQPSNQFGVQHHSTLSTTTTTTTTQTIVGQQQITGSAQHSVAQWPQSPMQCSVQQSMQPPVQPPVQPPMQESMQQPIQQPIQRPMKHVTPQPVPSPSQAMAQQASSGPAQKIQFLSKSYDCSQLKDSTFHPPPQTSPEPACDCTQLAATPPIAPLQSASTSIVTTVQKTLSKREERLAQREERKKQRSVLRNQQAVSSSSDILGGKARDSEIMGGKARQAAAAEGETALRQFDERVQHMLVSVTGSLCDQGFQYYRVEDGYLCGGGVHFVTHKAVDDRCTQGIPPAIEVVNDVLQGGKEIAPPADGWHEPMHWPPAQRIQADADPMPLKYDGTRWDLKPVQGQIAQARRRLQQQKKLLKMFSGFGLGYGF